MTNVEDYALKMLYQGAESSAEDDMDEDGELSGEDDLGPSPAQLGDTMTVAPGEWTPLDDNGTQIYLYGDQPVDIAFQTAENA